MAAELRDPGAVQDLVDRAMTDTGRLDVMVNNAGVSFRGPLADDDPEAWREMLEVNVLALAVGSRAAVRAMRACGAEGHIVNVSCSASRLKAPGFYGATKAAVERDHRLAAAGGRKRHDPRGHRDPRPDGDQPRPA